MFNFLKDKLKKWFKKSEEKAEKAVETLKEEKEAEKPAKEIKKTSEKEQGKSKELGFFAKIKEKFQFKITEEYFKEIFSDLELIMLENNVALSVVEKIKADLKKELVGLNMKKQEVEEKIKQALKISLESLFVEEIDLIEKIKSSEKKPYVIVFFGINGSGKTTSLAKISYLLQKNNISCILAASDTFRAASIEQLEKHAEKLGVKIIKSKYGSDPASVAFDAIQHAQAHNIKAVLIDTAGRMHTKENLMKEMEKIIRVSKPDLKIFVAESITGNDLVTQCQIFNEIVGIDGLILTKSDIDDKGGAIISASYITGKPILYLGVGQNYDDLEVFNPKSVLEKIGL